MRLTLYFPLSRGNSISQTFGQNLLTVYKEMGLKGHPGVDIKAVDCEPVFAAHDGIILRNEIDNKGGLGINLVTNGMFQDLEGDLFYWKTIYWHLKEFKCHPGDQIQAGDLIGYADNTGLSVGTHLHWGLKKQIKDENGNFVNFEPENGFAGACDPYPYLIMEPAQKLSILRNLAILYRQVISLLTRRWYN